MQEWLVEEVPDDVSQALHQDPEEIAREEDPDSEYSRKSSEAGWRHNQLGPGKRPHRGRHHGKELAAGGCGGKLPVSICQCSYSYCTFLIVLSYRAGISELFVVVCLDLVPLSPHSLVSTLHVFRVSAQI